MKLNKIWLKELDSRTSEIEISGPNFQRMSNYNFH